VSSDSTKQVANQYMEQFEARAIARKEHNTRLRGDGKPIFPMWPTLKWTTSRADRAVVSPLDNPSEESSSMDAASNYGLRNILPGAGWSARKLEPKPSKRRKPSAAETGSSPTTTVQKLCLDLRMYHSRRFD